MAENLCTVCCGRESAETPAAEPCADSSEEPREDLYLDSPEQPREELRVSLDEFETLVAEGLDTLPEAMLEPLDNVIFVVEERPENGEKILGEYIGYSLAERENYGFGEEPDRIVLYRDSLVAHVDSMAELVHEIRVTLVHEIAHFYGFDEAKVHELGWG